MKNTEYKLALALVTISLLTAFTSQACLDYSTTSTCDITPFTVFDCQIGNSYNYYSCNPTPSCTPPTTPHDVTAVPEPSTIVAGALLLLPFGISTVRILRKNKIS